MKLKKYLAVLITFLVVLGSASRAFPSYAKASEDKSYEAVVADISGDKYFPAVKEALSKAEESISLVMFIAELSKQTLR